MAIASIKHDFNTKLAIYDDTLRESRIWEQTISGSLNDAIKEHQIIPYLQPQVNDKGEMEGAEALVRWNHPTEGFLTPNRFIPIFEKNGMIAEVDKYMWEEACRILSKWKGEDKGLSISVNISPKDFYFMDVYKVITGLVEKYQISPAMLHLEITESFAVTDFDKKMEVINKFRDKGFIVEMDDFGSGYSSLNLLQDMPIDVLKIDMMFLRRSEEEEKARIILKTITEMAANLGIPSIVEGVETEQQLEMLRKMGCTMFQGYYFSKPVTLEELEDKMK
jgi:EAL domain-containing protein (putative c-di-GMP-specific phosphodiesterase class I)